MEESDINSPMRIAITADLHYPTTSRETLLSFAEQIKSHNPSLVALVGDIGETFNDVDYFDACIAIFRKILEETPILIVAGNHDLWVPPNANWNSIDLFERILPKMTLARKCHWLETENYVRDGIAFIGMSEGNPLVFSQGEEFAPPFSYK